MSISREELYDLYVNQKLSKAAIGEMFGLGATTVLYHMKKHNIPRRSLSEALAGKPKSEAHRKKLSESKKGINHPNFGKKAAHHGKRIWYKCPDDTVVSMRSAWEAAFAKYLSENEIYWQYEPQTFNLADGSAYTPDFYLPTSNEWVEVKGWFTDEHKKKIQMWRNAYPSEKLIIANRPYLTNLGIDLKQIWTHSKPQFKCLQCNKDFYRNYPDQRLCSMQCRNKFTALNRHHNPPLENRVSKRRHYNKSNMGSNNNCTKLKESDIVEIRKMKADGIRVTDIAQIKDTSPSNIYNICSGTSWKHINE